MNIDDYIKHIKDVLARMEIIATNVQLRSDEAQSFESISNQLKFILSYAESGKSFKQGLLARQRWEVKTNFEMYPGKDGALEDAIRTVYNDLDAHDYNIGTISREMSEYYFDFISNKILYHKDLVKERSLEDDHHTSSLLAGTFSDELYWANYTKGWIGHGIKQLQYFFLVNQFSFVAQLSPAIDPLPHPDAAKLVDDIERIAKFYETDEAEGTHMYLNPVEIKEIDGVTHLLDLKGNIVA